MLVLVWSEAYGRGPRRYQRLSCL
uniref:Uncharacterized protein n=1 Tax=Arundo donax TaxID=35708 RepID=A0A0A9A196_ARUDO